MVSGGLVGCGLGGWGFWGLGPTWGFWWLGPGVWQLQARNVEQTLNVQRGHLSDGVTGGSRWGPVIGGSRWN